ncbi:MAG: hypothetical protein KDD22_02485 [Bdellovibrionales bacterium]|nr:hypothetical protein [Bdellovibrionales bacterium]
MKNRIQAKSTSRWTLADWLAQKEKIGLMDLWLLQNTEPTLGEATLGYRYFFAEEETQGQTLSPHKDLQGFDLALYVLRLGFSGGYEIHPTDFKESYGQVNLRLLGLSQQSTRLNIFYGYRRRASKLTSDIWRQNYWGGELNLYITHFLGLLGDYRYYRKQASPQGSSLGGDAWSYGAFLEFGLLRLTGRQKVENENLIQNQTSQNLKRSGIEVQAELYF